MSKEALVAKIYRDLVYYPLIKNIRTAYYMHDEKDPIPDSLTAVSWMDGCLGQLHLMTREGVLAYEKLLKITLNKQSAARTAVEQAADVGAMFKLVRTMIQSMPGGEAMNSHLYVLILDQLNLLEKPIDPSSRDIVILQ